MKHKWWELVRTKNREGITKDGANFRILAELWIERIDDLTTDLWGGAGPDCCMAPTLRGLGAY